MRTDYLLNYLTHDALDNESKSLRRIAALVIRVSYAFSAICRLPSYERGGGQFVTLTTSDRKPAHCFAFTPPLFTFHIVSGSYILAGSELYQFIRQPILPSIYDTSSSPCQIKFLALPCDECRPATCSRQELLLPSRISHAIASCRHTRLLNNLGGVRWNLATAATCRHQ